MGLAIRRDRCRVFYAICLFNRRRLGGAMVAIDPWNEASRAA